MAGDWIKMRVDLHTDPAVMRMADVLGADSYQVVGWLYAAWVWADTHADRHGHVTLVSRSCLDTVTGRSGFGEAMESVGWLVSEAGDGAGITFPKFDRHMGEGAKERAKAAARKRLQRGRQAAAGHDGVTPVSRKCHADVTPESRPGHEKVTPREEKRREEKISEDRPSLPPAGGVTDGRSVGPPDAVPFDPLRAEQGARKAFEGRWAAAGLRPFSRLSPSLQGRLQSLLLDPWWAEHYPAALARAGAIPFLATGAGRQKGPLDVGEFLRDADEVRKILDGVYDPHAPPAAPADRREAERRAILEDARRKAG